MLELEVTSMEQNCMFLISNIFPMSKPIVPWVILKRGLHNVGTMEY